MTIGPQPFSYQDAIGDGRTRRELQSQVADGTVIHLRRGWYAVPGPEPEGEAWEKRVFDHLVRVQDALASRPGHVASHTSAALVHGLAVTIADETPVHLTTVDRVPSSQRSPGLRIHRSESVRNETELVNGIRVTTLARTVADVLRTRTLPHGLALIDDVLRRGLVPIEDVRKIVDGQRRWAGRPRALAALYLADPTRESWGESFSFAHLHLQGHAMPLPQVEVYDADMRFLGRLDALWPEEGAGGESDGEVKYFIPGHREEPLEKTVLRHLHEETVRHDRIEATGLPLVRWSPTEMADDPAAVSRRVNRVKASARPEAFTGWVRWEGRLRKLPFTVDRPAVDPTTLRYRRSRGRRRW